MSAAAESWSGRVGFILATTGSAVGIGSIWKFPYEVGANGGGVFLLFYLAGLVLVVVPLILAEFALGRLGRADAAASLAAVARSAGASPRWAWAGGLGVLTGFLILSFYSVIGGWTIGYAAETAARGLPGADPQAVRERFEAFLASPWRLAGWHALFMGAAALIVARGVARGIEAASMVLMPLLLALMLLLAGYAIVTGDLPAALAFMFRIDTTRLNAATALDALGLGFFSIGVGLGLMITYAAYAGAQIGLRQVAFASVIADTLISFLAGFAVFPIVFAHGLDPASGPGLVFVTLPLAFARMPLGTAAAVAFFVLLFVAALASAISLLELVLAWLVRRTGWQRARAVSLAAGACWLAGLATVLSFNAWSQWRPLGGVAGFEQASFFDVLDWATSNLMLPVGGLAIVLFAGWAAPQQPFAQALALGPRGAAVLRITLRWIAPLGIAAATVAPWLGLR
jgi:NSS family neurotransmitter:Na+ symporter